MSKENDLVRRGDVLGLLHAFVYGAKKYDTNDCKSEVEKICREELSKAVVGILGDFEKLMVELPTVEQPMSAVEFIEVMSTIENHVRYCKDCPLWKLRKGCYICACFTNIELSPNELVSNVQKWAQERPERSKE